MSFHRARKGIRVLILIGVVAVAGFTLASYLALKKRRAHPLPLPARIAEGIDQQTQSFTLSKSLGGQRIYTITASQVTNYKDTGKTHLRDVAIQLMGKNGRRQDRITAKECDFDGAAGVMFIPGDVEMDLQNPDAVPGAEENIPNTGPVHINTSGLTFNQNTGVASTEKDVRFRFTTGEGTSVGAIYNPGDHTVQMLAQVHFTLQQAELPATQTGGPASRNPSIIAEATQVAAGRLRFDSATNRISLTAPVQLRQGTRQIDAGDSEIVLNEERKAKSAVLHGGVKATDLDPQTLSEVQAADVNLELTPDGHISAMDLFSSDAPQTADGKSKDKSMGQTLVKWATASGQSLKAGESVRVHMLFDGVTNHLTNVDAQGSVRFAMSYLASPASLPLIPVQGARVAGRNEARLLLTDQAAMTFSPDGSSIKDLKTQGPSVIELYPIKPGEDKRIVKGQRFAFGFGDDGELSDFTATGKVSVTSVSTGKQARTRTSTSDNLWASFDPETHNIAKMRQWGAFYYEDPDRKATSEKAEYNAGQDSIVLDDNVKIWDADGTVRATNAVINTESGEMKAQGGVSTNFVSQKGPSNVTDSSQGPVNVSADRLDYNSKTQKALYQGRSRFWQGTNMIQADVIEVDRKTSHLNAKKNVYSIFGAPPKNDPPKAASAKKPIVTVNDDNSGPVEVRADELEYDDATNRANYHHNVRMKNNEAHLTCEELEIRLKPRPKDDPHAQMEVERAIATEKVHIVQPAREGTGDRAEYIPDEKKVILTGNLAAISDAEKGSTQGIRLTYFTGDDRILVDGKPGTPVETKHPIRPKASAR